MKQLQLFISSHTLKLFVASFAIITASYSSVWADDADRTGSPYFKVTTAGTDSADNLPLKQTEADVNIAGVIANVKIKQVYVNWGKIPLEAIYIFPTSTRAAIYSMKMTIGKRALEAKIYRKNEARQTYETAKTEGKTATLLEQERPNVFQMNVANIMPGDTITVEMIYTELLVPEEGVYEFVYPTVVGPRYSSSSPAELASTGQKWVANPYTKEGSAPTYTYNMKAHIFAGMPIQEAICPSHEADIKFKGKDVAEISLKPTEKYAGNKDFILRYRLAGDAIQSGVLTYEGEEENFFVAMIQPPKRVVPENIPGREYIFIIDVSGSMNGFPLETSKELLRNLIDSLKPTDLFNVLLFAGGNSVMSEKSVPASERNIKKAIGIINNLNGSGGTELLPALQRALALSKNDNYSRSIVIATDGYVTVEKEAFDLIRNNLGKANFFSFGIGSSVNRYIVEGMAKMGMGEPFVVTTPGEAKEQADKFRKYISSPVLTNIQVSYNGFDAYDYNPNNVPDVLAERPIIISGKYKGKAQGNIQVRGISGGGNTYEATLELADASTDKENSALCYLWARNRIQQLDDYGSLVYGEKKETEVTELGLKYNLLTAYTSFVAVDPTVRNQSGKTPTITQPLPLPEGVSDFTLSQNLGVVVVSAGKYEQSVSELVCSVSVRSCKAISTSSSPGFFLDGSMYLIEQDINTYDWEEAAARKAERKKLIAEEKAKEEAEKKAEEQVFVHVEKMPEFPGGEENLKAFINENLKYPKEEKENGTEGVVHLSFTIGRDGKIKDITVQKGLSKAFDKEAIRILKLMPEWIPGMQSGKAVNVSMTLPVNFKL